VLAGSLAGLVAVGAATPYAVLVGPLAMAGFALGVLVPVITAALLGSVEPSRSGVASGTLTRPGRPAACWASPRSAR
jgi:DHA2 family methylenomycin A resistance protein-like MFS transporter